MTVSNLSYFTKLVDCIGQKYSKVYTIRYNDVIMDKLVVHHCVYIFDDKDQLVRKFGTRSYIKVATMANSCVLVGLHLIVIPKM